MATIKASTNAADYAGWFNAKVLKQFRFAQMVALNRTARLVKAGQLKVMRQRFDRPTPYTMNSLFVQPAKKNQTGGMQARVFFKDDTSKGTPAVKFLSPQVYGGKRGHKRFEKALILKGYMKPGQFAQPAAGAKRDSYGNVQRGQIVQILSALKAFGEQGYMANRTNSRRSQRAGQRSQYFVDPDKTGIWQRKSFASGTGIRPVFIFADADPRYKIRIPFEKIADNIVKARFDQEFTKAFDEAMRTAR